MSNEDANIAICLSNDEALVYFEWLARFNEGESLLTDEIERQLLANVEAALEKQLAEPFSNRYHELVALAKARIRNR